MIFLKNALHFLSLRGFFLTFLWLLFKAIFIGGIVIQLTRLEISVFLFLSTRIFFLDLIILNYFLFDLSFIVEGIFLFSSTRFIIGWIFFTIFFLKSEGEIFCFPWEVGGIWVLSFFFILLKKGKLSLFRKRILSLSFLFLHCYFFFNFFFFRIFRISLFVLLFIIFFI